MSEESYYFGFDVGTGSGRAALLNQKGDIIGEATEATTTWRSEADHRIFEQSTSDIWAALCRCSQSVLKSTGIPPSQVKGVSFDATCSLAVVDAEGEPISVSEEEGLGKQGKGIERNIILWADHRAEEEAALINNTGEGLLRYVGGVMSLEMEVPKTLWLKKHMTEEDFAKSFFFDLPDYLTYRATGAPTRSVCSLACKFSFVPAGVEIQHASGVKETSEGWSSSFMKKIGLESFVDSSFEQVGGVPGKNGMAFTAGQPVGNGLSEAAAKELGLLPGTPVGSAVIDAYAGWIGTVAAQTPEDAPREGKLKLKESGHRLAAVAGTSTCHLVQSADGVFVNGVWGPYKNAIFPEWWMNEGGQSSTGQLIDFTMSNHPAYPRALAQAKEKGVSVFELLEEKLGELRKEKGSENSTHLTRHLHFYPDLHGNRSPLADPSMKGMIMGLTLDNGVGDLAMKLNVTFEAIALQTRHILDEMNSKGHQIDSIYMSGSQAKNLPLMRLLASVCNVKVIIPPNPSAAVVVGAAMLARCAAETTAAREGKPLLTQDDANAAALASPERLWEIMVEMTQSGKTIEPSAGEGEKRLLEVKYKIFRESIEIQRRWKDMVTSATESGSNTAVVDQVKAKPQFSAEQLASINKDLAGKTPHEILTWAVDNVEGLYQTTAFGLTGLAALDMVSKISLERNEIHLVPLIFLDTLYHFKETVELATVASDNYLAPLHTYYPPGVKTVEEFESKYGAKLWETDEDTYDYLVKVEPAQRAYEELGVKAVITGRRRSQGADRADLNAVEVDSTGLIKINPLIYWSFKDVKAYVDTENVPYNPLLDQGYTSIGDWHSTAKPSAEAAAKAAAGGDERAGRWQGKSKSECGLHKDYFGMKAAFEEKQAGKKGGE